MNRDYYTLHDKLESTANKINIEDAQKFNSYGYGIFWTVQDFGGLPRQKENLKKINSWAIELDSDTKEEQLKKIKKSLVPSLVIESKRGYQIYFDAKNASLENYSEIMDRLLYFFNADQRAKDVSRILRAPNYFHNKQNPYFVKEVWRCKIEYPELFMLSFFPARPKPKVETMHLSEAKHVVSTKLNSESDNFWRKIYELDCEEILLRLSGKACVRHEIYEFRSNTNGNKNIIINGKSSSCFIDKNKRISG